MVLRWSTGRGTVHFISITTRSTGGQSQEMAQSRELEVDQRFERWETGDKNSHPQLHGRPIQRVHDRPWVIWSAGKRKQDHAAVQLRGGRIGPTGMINREVTQKGDSDDACYDHPGNVLANPYTHAQGEQDAQNAQAKHKNQACPFPDIHLQLE